MDARKKKEEHIKAATIAFVEKHMAEPWTELQQQHILYATMMRDIVEGVASARAKDISIAEELAQLKADVPSNDQPNLTASVEERCAHLEKQQAYQSARIGNMEIQALHAVQLSSRTNNKRWDFENAMQDHQGYAALVEQLSNDLGGMNHASVKQLTLWAIGSALQDTFDALNPEIAKQQQASSDSWAQHARDSKPIGPRTVQ